MEPTATRGNKNETFNTVAQYCTAGCTVVVGGVVWYGMVWYGMVVAELECGEKCASKTATTATSTTTYSSSHRPPPSQGGGERAMVHSRGAQAVTGCACHML